MKDKLLAHLRLLTRQGLIRIWHDSAILPGSDWGREIRTQLDATRLFLLLVSSDFINSDYAYSVEMAEAMKKHREGKAMVIPVILRPCDWQKSDLATLQALPAEGKPVTQWPDRDEALQNVADGVRQAVGQLAHQSVRDETSLPVQVLMPRRSILLDGVQYTFIPGGTFPMGSDDGYPHEKPRHKVCISPFFLRTTPVTNREFAVFIAQAAYVTRVEIVGRGLCLDEGTPIMVRKADWRHPNGPRSDIENKKDHPVVQLSWFDAVEYCAWLSKRTGFSMGLPTEAQWEYAAAGKEGRCWPFGDTYSAHLANLEGSGTTPVGLYPANKQGLFDMAGNVYEWCADWFADNWLAAGHTLEATAIKDPRGPHTGTHRVLRGGSWLDAKEHSRCANRLAGDPSVGAVNWGVRCSLRITDALIGALLNDGCWGLTVTQMLSTEG